MNKEYFLSINEVSKRLDLPAYTLRYWEKQFPAAIKPTTGAGGRRYYRPETVNALEAIKELLYTQGLTIAGVKKLLKDGNFLNADFLKKEPVTEFSNNIEKPGKNQGVQEAIELLEQARKLLL